VVLIWLFGTDSYDQHHELIMWNSGYLAATLAVGALFRAGLAQSALNRRLFSMLILLLVGNLPLELGLWQAGLDPAQSLLVHTFLWFFATAGVAVTLERGLAPAACGYLAGFLLFAYAPHLHVLALTVPHGILAGNVAMAWKLGGR
jgi:hypothetical protein